MLVLVTLVAFLVQLYSLGYMAGESGPSLGRYYTYHSLFAFSMMGLVLSNNFLQMFIFWELVGLCSYLLIGFWYQKPEAARAAVKAFWVTKFGDLGFIIGIVLLWRETGTFAFTELFHLADAEVAPVAGIGLIMFLIYLGAVGKSAQFPLHVWLPDAMEGPTPVSALIHAATMVAAGVYLVTRTYPLFELAPDVLTLIAWIGAFTALLAASLALVQDDIKRVLAYSTVSQLGYMMAALGAGGREAGFFHLETHGLFKALLFLGAGSVIHAVGTNDIFQMGGLFKRMPQTGFTFLVGTLALAGLERRSRPSVFDARAHRVPDGLLYVPSDLRRLLREVARRRASSRGVAFDAGPALASGGAHCRARDSLVAGLARSGAPRPNLAHGAVAWVGRGGNSVRVAGLSTGDHPR